MQLISSWTVMTVHQRCSSNKFFILVFQRNAVNIASLYKFIKSLSVIKFSRCIWQFNYFFLQNMVQSWVLITWAHIKHG